MTFNVNTDVNFSQYNSMVSTLDAYTRSQFDKFIIEQFCNQATAGATLASGGAFTTLLNAALSTAKSGNYQF